MARFMLFLALGILLESAVFSSSLKTYSNETIDSSIIWNGYFPVAPIAIHKTVTLGQCLDKCYELPECVAANYLRLDQTCYLLNRYIRDSRDLILRKYGKVFKYLHVMDECRGNSSNCTSRDDTAQTISCGVPAPDFNPTIGEMAGRHRILGGSKARAHSYPYMVLLDIEKFGYLYQCHGALIPPSANHTDRSDLVITSAHCTIAFSFITETYIDANITVKLGKHNLFEVDSTQLTTKVSKIVRHPSYNNYDTYDYAILKLAHEIPFNDYIRPICLPEKNAKPSNPNTCINAGWGLTDNNKVSPVLLQLMQPVLNDSVCQSHDVEVYMPKIMMCAGHFDKTKNSCPGDSGSPLVCYEQGRYVAYGLLSFVNGTFPACNRHGDPAYYARISTVIDWIEETRIILGLL